MQHSVANLFPTHQQQQHNHQAGFDFRPRVHFAPTPTVVPPFTKSALSISQHSENIMLTPFASDTHSSSYGGAQQPYTGTSYYQQPQPQAYAAHDIHSSPLSEVTDTPRTLYKGSPQTDAGDMDVVGDDSDDEDLVVRRRSDDSSLKEEDKGRNTSRDTNNPLGFVLASTSPKAYTLGDLVDKDGNKPSESQIRLFASRLQQDIKSASLFSNIPATPIATLAQQQLPPAPAQSYRPYNHPIQASPAADVMAPHTAAVGSHTLNASSIATSGNAPLTRKSLMHLRPPRQPINPWQRPAQRPPPPITPYPAVMIDRSHLRRYRLSTAPEKTVSMKDLVVPGAVFSSATDPEVLAAELTSPPNVPEDLEVLRAEYDGEVRSLGFQPVEDIVVAPVIVPSQPHQALPATPMAELQPSPAAPRIRAGSKRAAPRDDESEYEDSDEDAIGESDDEYQATSYTRAAVAQTSEQPVKRARLSLTFSTRDSASPAPSSAPNSPVSRRAPALPTAASLKARARHLQPNLVRTNGCMHGCPLFFSTAYEARRHQEDTHGREEAYALADLPPNATIYPRDYRFLIQIGLHGSSDKWDTRTKGAIQIASRKEDTPLEPGLAAALVKFAKEWSKRYECPRCGTSFSRLDSKKRHFEKQCR